MERHYFPRELRALRVPGMQLTGQNDRIPRPAYERIQRDDGDWEAVGATVLRTYASGTDRYFVDRVYRREVGDIVGLANLNIGVWGQISKLSCKGG